MTISNFNKKNAADIMTNFLTEDDLPQSASNLLLDRRPFRKKRVVFGDRKKSNPEELDLTLPPARHQGRRNQLQQLT